MAGDGHGAQGDGEVSGTAIECPLERATLTLDVDDRDLRSPIARTADSWLAFGFDEDLDVAAEQAIETMLDLMERELGVDAAGGARARERRGRPARDAGRQPGQGRPRGAPRRRDPLELPAVAYEFKLPDLGEGLTEGEIARWLVEEGQEIAEDEPLVEIATDKTTVEIPSPAGGTVSRILVAEGEVVPVGTVLVVIGGDDGSSGHVPVTDTETRSERTGCSRVRPRARRCARRRSCARSRPELGVDLAGVDGHRAAGTDHRGRRPRRLFRTRPGARHRDRSEGTRVPLRGVQRQMFEHLTRAHREIPAVTWVEECDFSDVDLKRLVPLVLQAVAESLREFPELNARVEDGELVLLDRYDIGVAVQTEQGLVVPVVHGADTLSLDELDAEVRRLAEAAHAGTLEAGGAARRHVHRHERRQGGGPLRHAADQPSRGGDPRHPPDRGASGRARRRGRRPPDGERLGHVRPPRDRRQARRRLRARRDRAARELGGRGLGEVRLEHRLDPRRGRAAVEPRDDALARRRARATEPRRPGSARRGRAGRRRRPCSRAARSRSLRAMWASRLSIRRAGPERLGGEEDEQWAMSGVTWASLRDLREQRTRRAPRLRFRAWARGTGSA